MPLPFILGGALLAKVVLGAGVAAGAVGVSKGVKGLSDAKEAKAIQDMAETLLESEQYFITRQKESTKESIEELGRKKLNILANEINDFVNVFSSIKDIELQESKGIEEIQKLNFSKEELKQLKNVSIQALDLLSGLGAGVGTGSLLAMGAYGGVMALGTASTGTAIGTLSGVAATNATLAWLGGGALAAGGGGMALGTAVLGGLVAGPALLIAGGLFASSAKEKLHKAHINFSKAKQISKELEVAREELQLIEKYVDDVIALIEKTTENFKISLESLKFIVSKDNNWNNYTVDNKKVVAGTVKQALLLKGIIDTPLLTEEGMLSNEIKMMLE